MRRTFTIVLLCGALVAALLLPARAGAAPPDQILGGYAADTWASLVAMVDPGSGLPADKLDLSGARSVETSTTNIGAYLWSALVAERLGLIDHREAVARLTQTISTLERMERHAPSGQFYNWYDDSVNVDTGVVSGSYLALDQGMIMAAIGNALGRDFLRRLFVTTGFERALRPPIAIEQFGASPRDCTVDDTGDACAIS
jgi:hypothetical protein